jgi:hypothetical protein
MSASSSVNRRRLPVLVGVLVIIVAALLLWARPVASTEGTAWSASPSIEITATGQAVQAAGASVTISGQAESVTAAGARVRIEAESAGDVWLAGADVVFEGISGGRLAVAAARVTLAGQAQTLWAAGGNVDVSAEIAGDARIAGANVVIGPESRIQGSLAAGGANVTVDGQVQSRVDLAGGSVAFNGRTDGNLSVAAERLVLGPEATVGGDLVLLDGTDLEASDTATIAGATRRESSSSWWQPPQVDPRPGQFGFAMFAAGTAILAGLGLMLVGRGSYEQAAVELRSRPLSSVLIGLAVVILAPLLAVAIALTFIGIPIALGLLLMLPFVLLLGHAVAALGAADWVINRQGEPRETGRTVLYLVAGAVGFAVLSLIPYVGGLLVLAAIITGAGAFLRVLAARLRQPPTGLAGAAGSSDAARMPRQPA